MTGAPVRLAPAYSWQCPCGAKNWEERIPSPARARKHVRDGVPEEWLRLPTAVRCRSCGEAFAAEGG